MGMCGSTTGVRISTVLSVLLAAGLAIYTGLLFKDVYDEKNSDSSKIADAAGGFFNSISESVGSKTRVDPLKVINIKFYCYATVLGATALQLVISLLLLGCSGAKGGQSTAKLFIFINTWVMVAIAAVLGCFLASGAIDYQNDEKIQIFMGVCGLDFIFLFILLCVAGSFARS